MGLLRTIEHGIESMVEGVFGRVFRAHVQPVELARKLAKEMDENKTVSISRVYAPNEFHLYLAPRDREQFSSYEESLRTELADYLAEHARREGYSLLSRPRVLVKQDPDLSVGEFGIATRMAQPRRTVPRVGPRPPQPAPPADGPLGEQEPSLPKPAPREGTQVVAPGHPDEPKATSSATLTVGGKAHELTKPKVTIGRSEDCDVAIRDPGISRQHAEVRLEEGDYILVDLGSTNGVHVNGTRVQRTRLEPRDRIELGTTELIFGRGE